MITNVDDLVSGIITEGLIENGDLDSALSYIVTKFESDQGNAINIVEESLSKKGNSKNTSIKLFMLHSLNKNKTDTVNTVLNKGNLAHNLENDNTVIKNSTGIVDALNSVYKVSDIFVFRNKPNISKITKSYIANKKSSDNILSMTKPATLDISTGILISNSFK